MLKRSHHLLASLSLAAAVSGALAGCSVPALNSAQVKSLVQQAAVLLKAIDEGGIEISYGKDNILGVTVDGKAITPTFDENGRLLLGLEPGQEKNVELQLKDGQTVQMPLRAETADFAGGKPPVFEAFVMPGEGEGKPLTGEIRRPGQTGSVQDLFRARAIRLDLDKPELRNDQLRRLYIGGFQVPRQSFFVEDGDLFIHEANLWVIQQAKAGGGQPGMQPPPQGQPGMMPPPGGPQPQPGTQPPPPQPMALLQVPGTQPPPPGGMQPPPPGGMQPPPPGGMQPPPPGGMQPPPPGGMQPPPPGGMQPAKSVTFRLVVAKGEGKWGVVTIEATKTPNPMPMPQPGTAPVNVAQKPPVVDKADLKVSTGDVSDLAQFERDVVKVMTGNFLPPMPPPGQPGMQPPPPGQPGMQPPPPGQPGTQPPPPGQPGTQPPPPNQPAPTLVR